MNETLKSRWLLSISKFEQDTLTMSKWEGNLQGFLACAKACTRRDQDALEIFGIFALLCRKDSSQEFVPRADAWMTAVLATNSVAFYDFTEAGMQLCQQHVAQRDKQALACWAEYIKLVMKS